MDLVKVPYTGDPVTYRQAIETCPVPVVAAGGPKAETLDEAVRMAAGHRGRVKPRHGAHRLLNGD